MKYFILLAWFIVLCDGCYGYALFFALVWALISSIEK